MSAGYSTLVHSTRASLLTGLSTAKSRSFASVTVYKASLKDELDTCTVSPTLKN